VTRTIQAFKIVSVLVAVLSSTSERSSSISTYYIPHQRARKHRLELNYLMAGSPPGYHLSKYKYDSSVMIT